MFPLFSLERVILIVPKYLLYLKMSKILEKLIKKKVIGTYLPIYKMNNIHYSSNQ